MLEILPDSQDIGKRYTLDLNYQPKFRKFTNVSSFEVVQRFTSREVKWSTSVEQTAKSATKSYRIC